MPKERLVGPRTRVLCTSLFLVGCLAAPGPPARADMVTVGCAGAAGSFDYGTIGAALAALHAVSFRDHTVTVSGVCSEYVGIQDFENLTLIATPGAMILDPGTQPEPVVNVSRTENLRIRGFTIRGVEQEVDLVRIFDTSDVGFEDCVIERGGAGLFVNELCLVTLDATTVQDNGQGIRVSSGSAVSIGRVFGDTVGSVVQRNDGPGIQVDENSIVKLYGATIVRDNGGAGLSILGGRARFCCEERQRVIRNNGVGIRVNQGTVDLIGPAVIEANRSIGLLLDLGSSARFSGGQAIRDNAAAGVVAARSSSLLLNSAEVSGNGGAGIVLRENSSAVVQGASITGNGAEGLHLSYLSSATVFSNVMTDNTGFDFFCAPDSRARGEKAGIARMSCPGFSRSPDPDPGVPH